MPSYPFSNAGQRFSVLRFSSTYLSTLRRDRQRCAASHGLFSTSVERRKLPAGGHSAHLWFTGRKKYPILDPPAIEKLINELELLNDDASLKALFLRSTIAGADINHMKALQDAAQAEIFIRSIDKLCYSIQEFHAPVIAVIEGPCMGAGMEVAASCDIRIGIAGPKTIFAMPETKIGIPSVVQASLLPGLIGWGRARELLYFGSHITASEALTIGFLNALTDSNDLPELLAKWERLVDEAEPTAVIAQKALMRTWEQIGPGRAGIEASIQVFRQSFETNIPSERMANFLSNVKKSKEK